MNARLIVLTLLMALLSAPALAVNTGCLEACTRGGVTDPACAAGCPAETGSAATDHADDMQQSQVIEDQKIELERKKLQLQTEKFKCVDACRKKGDESDEYCEQSCTPDTP